MGQLVHRIRSSSISSAESLRLRLTIFAVLLVATFSWTLPGRSQAPTVSGVTASFSGLVFNRATSTFDTRVTLTNTTSGIVPGPIHITLENISDSGVTIANPSGTNGEGKIFVAMIVPAAGLALG